jgi:hypothetical protein
MTRMTLCDRLYDPLAVGDLLLRIGKPENTITATLTCAHGTRSIFHKEVDFTGLPGNQCNSGLHWLPLKIVQSATRGLKCQEANQHPSGHSLILEPRAQATRSAKPILTRPTLQP